MLDDIQHPGLAEWLEGRHTGASSKAIVAHLVGGTKQDGSYPLDGEDFGRCERLLTEVPSLRPMFHRMAEVNAYWAALVPEWQRIAALPEADRRAAIKSVIKPVQQRDPGHIQIGDHAHMRIGPVEFRDTVASEMRKADESRKRKNGAPPMKADADFDAAAAGAYGVAADELRQFIEQFEQLEIEKQAVADQQKELMAEAKARGYDTKVMRKVIALRKRDKDDIAEEEAVLEMYKAALGMV